MKIARTLGLFVLAVAGAQVFRVFGEEMGAARSRLLAGSRVVSTACGPVEVAEAGEGPPVLVVPGAGGGFDQGMAFAHSAVGEGFRVIAVSRFGYLRTPLPPDHSPAAQAEALAAVLDTLGIARAAVIALSAGAHYVARLALGHPEKVQALALVVPALYLPPEPGAKPPAGPPAVITDYLLRSDFLVWLLTRLAPSVMLRVAGVPPPVQRDLSSERRKELLDGFFPASARWAGLANDLRSVTPVAPDLPIEQLQMPVLLVGAADDPYRSAPVVRYSAGRIPGVRVLMLDRGGHVLVGQGRQVQQELRALLGASGVDHA
jgi:pimeloyl-ACP methyl ester carboxylesterase